MTRRETPRASLPLTGEETVFMLQQQRPRRIGMSDLQAELAPIVNTFSVKAGVAFTFPVKYAEPPTVIPLDTWNGNQCTRPAQFLATENTLTVTEAKRTARILSTLNAGVWETAPAGASVAVVVIGKRHIKG